MTVDQILASLANTNLQAFMRCIRHGESTQDQMAYRWLFGSTKSNPKVFDSFADHPRVKTYEKYDGQFIKNGKIDYTTAAGAYQIVMSTWDPIARKLKLKDFSPASQDAACAGLIDGRGALADVLAGRFNDALFKCRKEWASLPGAGYGQPEAKLADIKAVYEQYGGKYESVASSPTPAAPVNPDEPVEQPVVVPAPPPVKETSMAPFVWPALTAIMNYVPDLLKIFGSGSKVSDRNIKAVETVVNLAKEAIGARNEQELIETMASDPEAVSRVQETIKSNWYQIQEVGGGIKEARETAVKMQGTGGLWSNPAFVISLILLCLPTLLLVDVFFVHPDNYSSDGLRTQIVTGVLMVISMIGGFWLGTSFSSGKKDDAIINQMK